MNPCITIDVSKESSHVQGFWDINKQVSKPKEIEHTKIGFSYINEIFNLIKEKTNIEPLIFFEYTGVYHLPLMNYLEEQKLRFIPIPPLVAAKVRKSDLRAKKTDKRDCKSISYVYYENKLKIYYEPTPEEKYLRELQKHYCQLEDIYQVITVHLHELLDSIYPYYKRIFSEFDCYNSLYFLKEYPHPKFVTSHRVQTVANKYQSLSNHSANYCLKFADKLFAYIEKIVPGCNQYDYSVSMFKDLVEQAIFYKQRLDETIKTICQIIHNSDKKELLESIVSIPGVGHNTAARFISEIMNIDRFNSHKALVAFTGTDPHIEQSGDVDGKHLSITKLGNKRLRTILFQMVRSMIRKKIPDNHIKDFYKKKTQQGLKPKVALVACVNKLLGIIYQLNKTKTRFIYK